MCSIPCLSSMNVTILNTKCTPKLSLDITDSQIITNNHPTLPQTITEFKMRGQVHTFQKLHLVKIAQTYPTMAKEVWVLTKRQFIRNRLRLIISSAWNQRSSMMESDSTHGIVLKTETMCTIRGCSKLPTKKITMDREQRDIKNQY